MRFLSKRKESVQTDKSKPSYGRLDQLWRAIREIRGRLISIEQQVSTLRRDISRVDRNLYRQREAAQSLPGTDPGDGEYPEPLLDKMLRKFDEQR